MQYGVQITGVYIAEVTGDNAKAAGLEAGDMIYYFEDTKITSSSQLVNLIQKHDIGDEVTFTVVRNNDLLEFNVILEDSQKIQSKAAEEASGSSPENGGSQNESQNGQNGQGSFGMQDIWDQFFGGSFGW